jgi:predicted RNase H-like HicB family nuclease
MEDAAMSHYIGIFIEDQVGEWRVVFPDVPGCEAKGLSLDDAQLAAASALSQHLRANGTPPLPIDLAAVEKNDEWLAQNNVDLSKAIVSMISVAV